MNNKILHICYLGDAGSSHFERWVRYFKERGHKISIISFNKPKNSLEKEDVYQIKIGFGRKIDYILGIPKVRRLIKKLKPDILHAHYLTSYGFIGSLSGFHPFVASAWGSDVLVKNLPINFLNKLILRKFATKTVKKADLLHSAAFHLTDELIKMGADPKKIITFQYGVLLDKFKREKPKNSNQKIVISTRYFKDIYNLKLLIKAIPLVIKKLPKTKFILIGDGPQSYELKEMSRKLNIDFSTEFLGEILDENKLIDYLTLADVYVSTSLTDGTSLSLLEAMAAGCFPVVTDIAANREWILNGENGLLCSTHDSEDLANKIIRALENPNLREKAQAKNLEIIRERADFLKNMQIIENKYKELLR